MNQSFRKTLIASAIAALISSPAWATNGLPGNAPAEGTGQSVTEQPRDTSSPMKSGRDGARDSSGASGTSTGQSTKDSAAMGGGSSDDASRLSRSDNPLYSRTPEEVNGMEVIGANGEDIGKIKHVVLGSDRQDVYAVIASGGFLGLGGREFLVPLDELKVVGDTKVQLGFTKDAIASRQEYKSEQYSELESNRPISEFSAFDPISDQSDSTAMRASSSRNPDVSQSPPGVAVQRPAQSTDASSQMGSRPGDGAKSPIGAERSEAGRSMGSASGPGSTRGDDARSPVGAERSEAGRSTSSDARMGAKPDDAASRARINENPLYSRTPDDLSGMQVIGSDGEDVGKIKTVVTGSDHKSVHVVISSGGVMGIGAREVLVPLDELQIVGDNKVQVGFTKNGMTSRPEYNAEEYGELESNRPISEFSAFEPNKDRADPAAKERTPTQRY